MTSKKDVIDWRVIIGGMACLTIAEIYALSQGIDGVMFAAFVAIIAGVIGVTLPQLKTK